MARCVVAVAAVVAAAAVSVVSDHSFAGPFTSYSPDVRVTVLQQQLQHHQQQQQLPGWGRPGGRWWTKWMVVDVGVIQAAAGTEAALEAAAPGVERQRQLPRGCLEAA